RQLLEEGEIAPDPLEEVEADVPILEEGKIALDPLEELEANVPVLEEDHQEMNMALVVADEYPPLNILPQDYRPLMLHFTVDKPQEMVVEENSVTEAPVDPEVHKISTLNF
ncbi:hypothetical protein AMTR_s00031p00077670, partial [Amborella trichopoda]